MVEVNTSFGGESPIVVVINKNDQNQLEINQRWLKDKYKAISGFFSISCKTGTGITPLKNELSKLLNELPHIGDYLPSAWFNLRQSLLELDKDYMQFQEYCELCDKEGIEEKNDQETLIELLHDLGIVLNYKNDIRLKDTNVLNPEWITTGIYVILMRLNKTNQSILDASKIRKYLDSKLYPHDKQLFLTDMMSKFELCFQIENTERYLIPELLPKEQPDLSEFDMEDYLEFYYQYDVLLTSIMSRFIVKSHDLIKNECYWFSGVLLNYNETNSAADNIAIIQADYVEKEIHIKITGNEENRSSLLSIVRHHLHSIHNTIDSIKPREYIVYKGIAIDYEKLKICEESGVLQYFIPELRQEIDVKRVLNGISTEKSRAKEYQQKNIYHIYEGGNVTNKNTDNKINVKNAINSPIMQGSDSIQTQSISYKTSEIEDLKILVNLISDNIADLNLSNSEEKEMVANLKTVEAQLETNPNSSIVRQSVKTIRNITEGAIGSMLATATQPRVWTTIQELLSRF